MTTYALLIGLPLAILFSLAFVTQGTGTVTSSQANAQFGGGASGGSITYICSQVTGSGNVYPVGGTNVCLVASSCSPAFPSPAFCFPPGPSQYLQVGNSVTVSYATAAAANGGTPVQTSAQAFSNSFLGLVFAGIGPAGFIGMLIVVASVLALLGLAVFGSGFNSESIKILVVFGMTVGLWLLLSGAEGFVNGNPLSFFSQLNALFLSLGTGLYVLLTLVYVIGVLGFYTAAN